MTLTTQAAVEFPLSTLCEVINRSFKGYVGGDINFTPRVLAGFIAQGDVNLTRSLVALNDGDSAGIAMLARRGWSVRVALMGVVEGQQNKGVGRWLLGQVADEARQNGDKTLVLEVIEQNPRAVHLYQSCGFTIVRRLMGYNGANLSGEPAELTRIDPAEAARKISGWQSADLPWQCAGETLVTTGTPHVAYRMDGCYALCSNPEAETIAILGLAVPPEQQRQGKATRLVSALIAAHSEKNWRVSPICPEEYGAIFTRNGFTVEKLNQFQMEASLV